MERKIVKVPYKDIKQAIIDGHTNYRIMKKWGVPESVCRNIRDGKKVLSYQKKSHEGIYRKGYCSCCGDNRIDPGNKFLCKWCFSGRSMDVAEEHGIPNIKGA